MSDCRSIGRNYRPCSQTRKISIGVMVDSQNKTKSAASKEDGVVVSNKAKVASNSEFNGVSRSERPVATFCTLSKQAAAPDPTSPWISTRPFDEKMPTEEAFPSAQRDSDLPASSFMRNKFNARKEASLTHPVQLCANQDFYLQFGNRKEKRLCKVPRRKKGAEDKTEERVEQCSFAVFPEVPVSGRKYIGDRTYRTENTSREALKMKLQEILGTVSSPNKQSVKSPNAEERGNKLNPETDFSEKHVTVANPQKNSDTIETASEVDHDVRRPVTRSATRKRRLTKVQPIKEKDGLSSSCKHKRGRKKFSFEEGRSGGLHFSVNSSSFLVEAEKIAGKRSKIEPCKILFPKKDGANDNPQETGGSKTQFPSVKASSHSNREEMNLYCTLVDDMPKVGPTNHTEKVSHKLEGIKKVVGGVSSPALSGGTQQQEEHGSPDFERMMEQQNEVQSPTFQFGLPSRSPLPNSPPKTSQNEQVVSSHAPLNKNSANVGSFKTLQTSRPDCYRSNSEAESSDGTEDLMDSPTGKSIPIGEEKDIRELSKSSSEERASQNSEVDPCANKEFAGSRVAETLFPKFNRVDNSNFMCYPTKRLHSQDNANSCEFSPVSCSAKGTDYTDVFHTNLEQDQDDELARAAALFALALKRVEGKLNSVASQKSSEIMISTTEAIRLQLQNVVSRIQTDVVKLTTLSKTKRKHLEARFQEQQNVMKRIHQKFREEVDQHLLDCRSTVEGLEAHQKELKGCIQRQKLLHKKLVLEAEEAVGIQLNDAQRRMTTIQKLAKEKMLQLKFVVAQCLKEGVLG